GLDGRKEELKALGGELGVHELLAVAVGPQHVPALGYLPINCRCLHHRATCQGFAPFGSSSVFEPTCRAHRRLCCQHRSRHGISTDMDCTTCVLPTCLS